MSCTSRRSPFRRPRPLALTLCVAAAVALVPGMALGAHQTRHASPDVVVGPLPLPDPHVSGYAYPESETTILEHVDAGDDGWIATHAWGLWASLTTTVLPDLRLKGQEPMQYGRIAVCVHVYYTDMLDEILALSDTIPCAYDFIATTDTEQKKELIENTVRGRANIADVIVRVVEQNRGRDMSALFISCRDLFIDDRYALVCRLHTKKTPHLDGGRGRLFKRHMFENLLNSRGYTSNVLDMFHDKPWIGVAVPPLVHISYPTMGHV